MKTKKIIILLVIIPIVLLIFDFVNITKYIPITFEYDWLGFVGAYITGICTLILGIVSIKQNDALSNINEEMLKGNMIISRFSQLDLETRNYYDPRMLNDFDSSYGINMIAKDKQKIKKELYYTRLILHFKDKYDLPLMYGKIDNLEIYYNYKKAYVDELKKEYISKGKEVKLEVTPQKDGLSYYLPICLIDDKEGLNEISNSEKLRIVATIYIKNSFNVISEANYTIHLKNEKTKAEDWVNYTMTNRKIYFKEIKYKNYNKDTNSN